MFRLSYICVSAPELNLSGRFSRLRAPAAPAGFRQIRGVAQPGRALRSGRRSRRFKSFHPDHYFSWSFFTRSHRKRGYGVSAKSLTVSIAVTASSWITKSMQASNYRTGENRLKKRVYFSRSVSGPTLERCQQKRGNSTRLVFKFEARIL